MASTEPKTCSIKEKLPPDKLTKRDGWISVYPTIGM